jgi:transposase
VRRLNDQEGQKLQQIVRRGSTSSVRYRRAMMLLASAGGNRVPVIAQLVQADEDTVRDVIHRFHQIGPACLDPRWAGGRPRLLSPDDEDFVVQTATTRPTKLSQPITRWSIRKLLAYLRKVHGRVIRIGREALRSPRAQWRPQERAHNRQMRHKCAFYAFGSQSASCSIGSVSPMVSRPSSGMRA